ncbi:MAG: GGDEF domain-containing protein [Xanthomonadales bacterium]|nr:GGDEF domain-containing protein [Xanthomonadales bacterium]
MLETSPRLLARFIEMIGDAVCVVDREGFFRYISPGGRDVFGREPEAMLGTRMLDYLHPDDHGRTLAAAEGVMRGAPLRNFHNRYLRADGSVVDLLWSARWFEDEQLRIAVARDVTELKRAEARLVEMARTDPLTGLANRLQAQEWLQRALARAAEHGARLALLYLDLDRFKDINDRHGHPFGDRVLQAFGARLRDLLAPDWRAARLGGDEFLVLLPEVESAAAAQAAADALCVRLCAPIDVDGRIITPGPSIGLALYPDDAADADNLVREADRAMYRAKAAGGSCVRGGALMRAPAASA